VSSLFPEAKQVRFQSPPAKGYWEIQTDGKVVILVVESPELGQVKLELDKKAASQMRLALSRAVKELES